MRLERPHEISKKDETCFFKKEREYLKSAYQALEDPHDGKLLTFISLNGFDFMEDNNFLEPERKDVKRYWNDHSIPKKYADGKNCGDIEMPNGRKASTYRLTHHFRTSNGWGGICLFNDSSDNDRCAWYMGYIVDKAVENNLKTLPPPYNKNFSMALSYLTAQYQCQFNRNNSYTDASGYTKEYYRCSFDKPAAPAEGKKRISKKEKEASACKFTFMLISDGHEIKFNLKNDHHDHNFSNYQPNYILPAFKEFIISSYQKPLCFIKKVEIENLRKNFENSFPALASWKFTSHKQVSDYCYNQSLNLFNDKEISTASNINKVLNSYEIKEGKWSKIAGTSFKSAISIMPDESPIKWVGTFLGYDLIEKLAAVSNYQLFFDGTYGVSKTEGKVKKDRMKTDLYLLNIQAPDFCLTLAAFLSVSDTTAAVCEGLDEILKIYNSAGVRLFDHFKIFMSDNQSGLHSVVQRRYNLIAMSCFWHIGDAQTC